MKELSRRDLLKASAAGLAGSPLLGHLNRAAAAEVDPNADAVLVDGEAAAIQPGSFTIAVLPDTQNYSEKFPEIFKAQTQWIVDQQAARNIACVLHLGDITNHSQTFEWENAVAALSLLDGKVPYCFVPGNHDYSTQGKCEDRSTRLNEFLPVSQYQSWPTFGGVYDREPDRMENSFHRFEAGGRKWLVVALEFGPRRDVIRWANQVVTKHPDHQAILITHAYMYYDDTRYDWQKFGKDQTWNPHDYGVAKATGDNVCDGEELWNSLVSKHENFALTLNGHVLKDGLGRLTSTTPGGRNVHQMLVNFQMRPKGGDGWLRLLEFRPDNTLQVSDYSPTRKQRNESPQNQFLLKLGSDRS
ncbi:metallophosphoesterase [Planctomicrobium piriforme]|uniref:3',5'-cyclic AMP phosphodiesterase CpdA n=1 Tax=Planctomicrobium piriforme TaxID=1576369 RepID=A0A1I3SB79_9PLAN|nr:metallophosphoesterase [Planctomicrobium piriforme]SFJ55998.1 3',5'-cyclic AMP phosphodiesterase CpdA [Planctomicrobium piriforme]